MPGSNPVKIISAFLLAAIAVLAAVFPAPAQEAPLEGLFWYDPCGGVCTEHLEALKRTSNLIMLREREDEYRQFLHAGFKKAIVGCYGHEGWPKAARIVSEIKEAGLEVPYLLFSDEPDLDENLSMAEVDDLYRRFRTVLDEAGHTEVKLAPTWSLAGTGPRQWQVLFEWEFVPRFDFIATTGWYSADSTMIHLVKDRMENFLAFLDGRGHGRMEIMPLLKAFSKQGDKQDWEDIYPEWVMRQLRCVGGSGNSVYDWINPNTGDVATVTVEPMAQEYLERTKTVGFYKMDSRPNEDTEKAGGNSPEIIEALAGFAAKRGLDFWGKVQGESFKKDSP